jgi:quercetin dioxygenase-like cupin family protein
VLIGAALIQEISGLFNPPRATVAAIRNRSEALAARPATRQPGNQEHSPMFTKLRRNLPATLGPVLALGAMSAAPACLAAESEIKQPPYSYATNGVLDNIGTTATKWKLVVDESNLGGKELEVAEVTIPADTITPSHAHGALEIIYVLSGVYEHEVNGKLYRLKPGMVGIVRPGDKTRHLTRKDSATKLLIIWAPAGEARRLQQSQGTKPEPVPEVQK